MKRPAQAGVAVVTALLVVALAAAIALTLLSEQSQALTRTARAMDRAQAGLWATPMIDWARAILLEMRKSSPVVHLRQPWAAGVQAQPLEGALASGLLRDETAKFNLNNLVTDTGQRSEPDRLLFRRLLLTLKLDPALAETVSDWVDRDSESATQGAEDGHYMGLPVGYRAANRRMVHWQELALVRGIDADVLLRLTPWVTALPERTRINFNTASIELLTALLPDLGNDEILAIIAERDKNPFTDLAEMRKRALFKTVQPTLVQFASTGSDWFTLTLGVTAGNAQVRQSALIHLHEPPKWPSIIWVQSQ